MAEEQEFYRINLVVQMHDRMTSAMARMQSSVNRFESYLNRARQAAETLDKTRVNPTASLTDRVTSVARTIRAGLDVLTHGAWVVAIKAYDGVTSVVKRIGSALSTVRRSLFSIQGLAATALAGLGIGKLWDATVGFAGSMEQAQIAFNTMLGAAGKAQSFLRQLWNFAAATPFEFPQVQQAAKNMLAFGFAADEVLPALTAIGDAASGLGLGAEGIDRLVLALGQMRAKGKVAGQEMMQLTEAGVPVWDILAKKMHTTTAAVMQLSEKGLIPANQAIKWLLEGMEERFPHMMEAQSRTYVGLMSTIRDNVKSMFGAVGAGILQSLNPRLQKIVDWFTKNQETVERWKDALMRFGKQVADSLLGWFERTFRSVGILFDDSVDASDRWLYQLKGLPQMDLSDKIKIVWEDIKSSFDTWWDNGGRQEFVDLGTKVGNAMMDGIMAVLKGVWGNITETNKQAWKEPTAGNLLSAGVKDFLAISLVGSVVGGAVATGRKLAGLLGQAGKQLGKWFGAGSAAGTAAGAETAEGVVEAANVTAKAAADVSKLASEASAAAAQGAEAVAATGGSVVGHLAGLAAKAEATGALKWLPGLSGTIEGIRELTQAIYSGGDLTKALVEIPFDIAGSIAGSAVGGAAGALVSGPAAPVGALVGAGVGSQLGISFGKKLADSMVESWRNPDWDVFGGPLKEFDVLGHGIRSSKTEYEMAGASTPFEHWKREPSPKLYERDLFQMALLHSQENNRQPANFTINVTVNSSAVNAADMAEEVGNIIAKKVKQAWINSPVLAR